MKGWQYGFILPLAGGVTIGLGLMMRSVVMTEFVPQPTDHESLSVATYVFDEVIICGRYQDDPLPKLTISLPEPPRRYREDKCTYQTFENPHDNQKVYSAPKPESTFPDIDINLKYVSIDDAHCHGNILRPPPKFPSSFVAGDHSGFYDVSFIYDETGFADEIDIINCTHESLEAPTREAVQTWRNCSNASTGGQRRKSTVRYDLMDESGEILPYP